MTDLSPLYPGCLVFPLSYLPPSVSLPFLSDFCCILYLLSLKGNHLTPSSSYLEVIWVSIAPLLHPGLVMFSTPSLGCRNQTWMGKDSSISGRGESGDVSLMQNTRTRHYMIKDWVSNPIARPLRNYTCITPDLHWHGGILHDTDKFICYLNK